MKYVHFDFLVEGMNEEEANALLDIIVKEVELKGRQMGGGFYPETDRDYDSWSVVKGCLRKIGGEIMANIREFLARVYAAVGME